MKAPKIQRWVDLLAALLRRSFPVSFEELAREVPAYAANPSREARRRTFERDKDELRGFGIPIHTVESDEGETTGYRLRSRDFYLPYLALRSETGTTVPRKVDRFGYGSLPTLAFEADELAAVTAAAARVRELGDPLLAEQVDSAMRKLAWDLPVDAAAADTRLVPARHAAAVETLATLGDALERRKRVTFDYHSIGSDATSRRMVEAYGLFFLNQHWYLAARTADDDTVKNYRLSRIAAPELNRARPGTRDYEIPASFDLRKHARARHPWELGAGDAIDALVALRSPTGAASVAWSLGQEVPGDSRIRRFRVRRLDAFARWLLSFAGGVEPVDPPEVVDEYRRLARETLAHHSAPRPA